MLLSNHGAGLVADETSLQVVVADLRQELRRNVNSLQLDAQSVGDDTVYLVPGHALVGGDVECLTDSVDISAKPCVGLGKVGVVGDRPERGTVAVYYDRLALDHSLDHLPASVISVNTQRHRALVVGVAWPNYRHGEAPFPVHSHEELLAGDLVP